MQNFDGLEFAFGPEESVALRCESAEYQSFTAELSGWRRSMELNDSANQSVRPRGEDENGQANH